VTGVQTCALPISELLLNTRILCLDMGLLNAGAGMKGEFENRLKSVIQEVKASPQPIIMFIDEAHTLIGSGNQAGSGDAANLLKPALARGELRTIAATTWSEYKKYFEKDAALARRFQLVKLDEPDVASSVLILRGLKDKYEAAHGVIVRDDAIVVAAELSSRYITGRQLPDKAVDLLDTCAARVKVQLTAKPAELEDKERAIQALSANAPRSNATGRTDRPSTRRRLRRPAGSSRPCAARRSTSASAGRSSKRRRRRSSASGSRSRRRSPQSRRRRRRAERRRPRPRRHRRRNRQTPRHSTRN
jgi:ATP-dependent Clp protease ATP-binding subunit ClpA